MELLKKTVKSLLIGTLAGIGIALLTHFFVPDLIDRLEHQSYYMRYRWKFADLQEHTGTETEPESQVCIVDIDDRSQDKLGMYWNWDRSYHARLIDRLSSHSPGAIIFDVNFYSPEDTNHIRRFRSLVERARTLDPQAPIEERFAESISRAINYDKLLIGTTEDAGNVFHAVRMSEEVDYSEWALSQMAFRRQEEWHEKLHPSSAITLAPDKLQGVIRTKSYIDGIFPELARVSRDIGHINLVPNADGVIREVPLLYSFGMSEHVYLPMSMRAVATLFGTPNDEIRFEPKRYIDIGRPFKVRKDSSGALHCSYPTMSVPQLRAILQRSQTILSLQPGQTVTVSSFLQIGRDEENGRYIAMHCGVFPEAVVAAFRQSDPGQLLNLPDGGRLTLDNQVAVRRETDIDCIISAPVGDGEWWMTWDEFRSLVDMVRYLSPSLWEPIPTGEVKLAFHDMTVSNRAGELVSSIPVLRGKTLRDLCATGWEEFEAMAPGFRRDFGEPVRIPLTPQNEHIITFFGPRGKPFTSYSFYDLMKDRIHGGLDGKIFIVGSSAASTFDIVSVPLDNVYPGTEVHASLIHSFLTNTFVRRLEIWEDFLILLLVGIFMGFISYMTKPVVGAFLSIIFVFAYFLTAMTLFGTNLLWIEIARPTLTIMLTFTAVMAYRYIAEEKDRKFLQTTFKRYLSPEVIDIMYRQKQVPELGGEEGIRTAYFTDIQSFSTFSEKLGSPTRLVELLNEYLSEMTDSLLEHYGTLDKYEGDAIIAFFGAPMPMEDHAQQACLTALDMQRKLGELRRKWRSEGDKWPSIVHNMRMRIGVNTGPITTGNMGSAMRMNYTMMGDAVNLAARLESAAKQYGIYTMISHFTYDLVRDRFEARQLDKITVVGKSEPVVVYELLGERGSLDAQTGKLVSVYTEGLEAFYAQKWDRAIEILRESEKLEPYREIAPGNMTPSTRVIGYAEKLKVDPPGPDWDGVTELTAK